MASIQKKTIHTSFCLPFVLEFVLLTNLPCDKTRNTHMREPETIEPQRLMHAYREYVNFFLVLDYQSVYRLSVQFNCFCTLWKQEKYAHESSQLKANSKILIDNIIKTVSGILSTLTIRVLCIFLERDFLLSMMLVT